MSGQTRAGSARLNAYHGTKRQLTGTSAGQVAPAWRTTNGAAAMNGSTSPLSKKALQRGSKMLLSNLPMDVAESELEVRALTFFIPSIVPSLLAGAIQENSGPNQGDFHHLQQPRATKGNGSGHLSTRHGRRFGSVKVRR
jgi:hypothetical protein